MGIFRSKFKNPQSAAREAAEADGLICAYLLDGQGHGRELSWSEVKSWSPEQGTLWIHLNRMRQTAIDYINNFAGLDRFAAEALLQEDTRPRLVRQGDGLIVNLRGINFNPGSEPEDMISLRCFMQSNRLITTRARRLMAIEDIRASIAGGYGPKDESECLFRLASFLLMRVGIVIQEIEEEIDTLETQVLSGETKHAREKLSMLRKRSIAIRRHLVPQRDALARLEQETHEMLEEIDVSRFRELADETTRYIEDLDSVRERAIVIQDEIGNRLTERQNRHAYTLSVVAAIMLPLSFITSLFGVTFSEGVIPFANEANGFWTLMLLLGAVAVVQIIIFRMMKWF
jgi:zinc transporter